MSINPVTISIMVFATLIGVIIRAAVKLSSYENLRFDNSPMWVTLSQAIFLIMLTIMWIIIFSGIL
jgi:hypothetical protein